MPPLVSVVTLNYESDRFFPKFFDALATLLPKDLYEVIVVDNASSAASRARLAKFVAASPHATQVRVVWNERNVGYARGNNSGAALATGKYLYLLNNDAFLANDGLLRDLERLESDARAGAVGSRLNFAGKYVKARVEFLENEAGLYGDAQISIPVRAIRALYDKIVVKHGFLLDSDALTVSTRWARSAEAWIPVESRFDGSRLGEVEVAASGDLERVQTVEIGGAVVALAGPRTPVAIPRDHTFDVVQNRGSFVHYNGNSGDLGFQDSAESWADGVEYTPQKSVCGGALLIGRELFRSLGGFHPLYFAYYEDVDLAQRIRARGLRLLLSPHTLVYHHHAGSFREHSPAFVHHVTRSFLIYLVRLGTAPQLVYQLLRLLRSLLKRSEAAHRGPRLRALLAFVGLLPELTWQRLTLRIGPRVLLYGTNTEQLLALDPKRDLVAVYNPHLRIKGGGEKSSLDFVEYYARRYPDKLVVLFTDEKRFPSLEELCDQFGIELPPNVQLVSLPTYQPKLQQILHSEEWASFFSTWVTHRVLTRRAWLFLNHCSRSFFVPAARHNHCVVMYPFAGQTGSTRERRSQRRLIRFVNRSYSKFICNSRFTLDDTMRYWRPGGVCEVVYPFFEPRLMKDAHDESFVERVICAKRAQPSCRIISLGRFTLAGHGKNQHLLLRSFERLKVLRPEARLTLVGASEPGNERDERYYASLKQFAREKGLAVTFVPDCPRAQLETLLLESNVFWEGTGFSTGNPLPNHAKEHFGIVVIEAMRYGLVPFAFDDAGPREIIEHGRSGFKLSAAVDLADATHAFFGRPLEERISFARAAIRRSRHFSKERFYRDLDRISPAG